MNRTALAQALIVCLGILLLPGCGGSTSPDDTGAMETDASEAAPKLEITPEIEGKLVAADVADGDADGVVTLCTGCGLAMEGLEEHVAHVGEYDLHFCSDHCLEEFSKDPAAPLLALAVPVTDEDEPEAPAP